jgi:hypothetical protein
MKIIDAHGPFFLFSQDSIINWSKLPFTDFEKAYEQDATKTKQLLFKSYHTYFKKITQLGYDTIALDDLAHITTSTSYTKNLQKKLAQYQEIYIDLIQLAKSYNLSVFIRTDILFYTTHVAQKEKTPLLNAKQKLFFCKQLQQACEQNIDGIIIRIGESDGVDVTGDFTSKLTIKTPKQLNSWLKDILNICETHNKQCILRTWSLGAHDIGDIIWNPQTLNIALTNIESDNLILSLKPGEGDFFRNVPLNPLFKDIQRPFIVELQAKREYDGFGVLPFYAGWDYESVLSELSKNPNLKGISVWCQEGGWSGWKHITFLENSTKWTELNTIAASKLYDIHTKKDLNTTQNAADSIVIEILDAKTLIFLKAYARMSQKLLYAKKQDDHFLRRIRIPPLLWLYWDNFTINKTSRAFVKSMQYEYEQVSLDEITLIQTLGNNAKLDETEYVVDTLILFWHGRESLLDETKTQKLREYVKEYELKYPSQFNFTIDNKKPSIIMRMLLSIAIRNKRQYRLLDKLFLTKPASLLLQMIVHIAQKTLPKGVRSKGMSVKTFFK